MKHGILRYALLVASGSALGCANSPPTVAPPAAASTDSGLGSLDAGGGEAAEGAGSDAGGDGAPSDARASASELTPPSPLVGVRIAHWSSDSAGVDVCLRPHGSTSFRGPMMEQAALARGDAGDAGSPGIFFTQVSSYFLLPPAQYDARFVPAGATDCTVAITTDATNLATLTQNDALETIALLGDSFVEAGPSSLKVMGFLDDAAVAEEGLIGVRFIHAAPSVPPVDVGTGLVVTPAVSKAFTFDPMFDAVAYGTVSNVGEADPTRDPASGSADVDARGYMFVNPLEGDASVAGEGTFGVRQSVAERLLAQAGETNLAAGVVVTLVLLETSSKPSGDGGLAVGDSGIPIVNGSLLEGPLAVPGIQLLECLDNAGDLGLLGSCLVVAP
jgi:hypothetical protein